ncbi:MAG: phosphate ABC transporter permease subunit PstC [Thermoanaerobaculia bacterium]
MSDSKAPARVSRDDRWFRFWMSSVGFLVLAIVGGIGFELFKNSRLPIAKFGWKFWTESDWDPVSGEFGALPFIWGTLYSSIFALVLAAPIGVGIAIFITEIAPNSVKKLLSFLTELLAAIPSIVYGLWGIFVLVPLVRKLETAISKTPLHKLPIFTGPPYGIGMLAAGLILTVMVIPFVSAVSREVLKAVPMTQREAAYALGATKWEAMKVALRYGRVGIFGAIILGFGRAFGETMAVTMVIGNNPQIAKSLFAPQYSMAAVIANEFTEATYDLYLQALIEIGLVLFVITFVLNVVSRLFIWSVSREPRSKSAPAVAADPVAEPA